MIVCNICKERIGDAYVVLCGEFCGVTEEDQDIRDEINQDMLRGHYHLECIHRLFASDFSAFEQEMKDALKKANTKKSAKKKAVKSNKGSKAVSVPIDWVAAERMWTDGKSLSDIASVFGLSYGYVWKHFDLLKKQADEVDAKAAVSVSDGVVSELVQEHVTEAMVCDAALSESESEPESESNLGSVEDVSTSVDAVTDSVLSEKLDDVVTESNSVVYSDSDDVESETAETVKDLSELSGDEFVNALLACKDPAYEIRRFYPIISKNKNRLDVGKVFALYRAGWSLDAIAHEVRVSDISVIQRALADDRFRGVFLSDKHNL